MTADYSSKPVAAKDDENFFQRWLILPKTLYFLLNIFVYAFHGVMAPFFLEQWGFTLYQYGFASAVICTNFVGAMFWTNLADRTGKYKTIIVVASTLYTLVALATLKPMFADGSILRYIYVFVLLGLFNFFLSAAFPLVDAQILGMLAANPKVSKDQFGNQRMFGALGHFAATLLSFSIYNKKNPMSQAIFQIIVSVVFMLAVYFGIPDVKPLKGHGHHGGHSHAKKEGAADAVVPENRVWTLLSNPSFLFFMLFVAASGMVRSVTTNYQKPIGKLLSKEENIPVFITNFLNTLSGGDKHKNQNIMTALLDTGRTISEVLVYYTAKYIKNALGIYWVLAFSQITGIARLWGYAYISYTNPYAWYLANGLELLKGFNSGLISSSAIPIASSLAPAGCEGTAQGLYSGNYSGASMAVGGLVAGSILYYLYDPVSADGLTEKQFEDAVAKKNFADLQIMFNYVSIISIVITLLLISKFIFVDRVMGLPGFPRKYSSPQH